MFRLTRDAKSFKAAWMLISSIFTVTGVLSNFLICSLRSSTLIGVALLFVLSVFFEPYRFVLLDDEDFSSVFSLDRAVCCSTNLLASSRKFFPVFAGFIFSTFNFAPRSGSFASSGPDLQLDNDKDKNRNIIKKLIFLIFEKFIYLTLFTFLNLLEY